MKKKRYVADVPTSPRSEYPTDGGRVRFTMRINIHKNAVTVSDEECSMDPEDFGPRWWPVCSLLEEEEE